ncbi:hypothetical protein OG792_18810 [Micromonospora sp. NBC_01699]|uniref:PGPGW domain-containing protein n=1 Tax=Micromonospora sp. NBC_01699 TaxID=2975984 RepID=UPI002E29F235|nr:PGPGW domain-containing protein [Micromonospora sp. NBC_01699]
MNSPDSELVKRATATRLAARRERHRRRPAVVRALIDLGGGLLSLVGLVLLWAPEFGLPLLLAGFGLLALEFDWAFRARAWTEWRAALLRRRFVTQPPAVQAALPITMLAIIGIVLWRVLF